MFSWRYLGVLVPGIGKMSSCFINYASVNCPVVQLFSSAMRFKESTSFRFFGKFSAENRGMLRRKSPSSKSSGDLYWPVSMPRPSGEYATVAIPSSRHVASKPSSGFLMSNENGLYSI